MVRSLLFEGALNRFTSGQSLSGHKNRTGQGEGTEQRPWSPHRRGRSGRGAKSRTRQFWGVLEGTFPGPSCHRAGDSPGSEPVLGCTGQSHSWHQGSPLPAQRFCPAGAPTSSPPCPCPPHGLPSQHRCLITRIWAAPGGSSSNLPILGKGKQELRGV